MANKWLAHVKKTMKSHKGKKFGDILKMAKKTYKGGAEVTPSASLSTGPLSPASVGGRKTRKSRKSRKSRKGGMDEMKGMGYGMY
jgi:hypothetical protein